MAFKRLSLVQWRELIAADVELRMPGANARQRGHLLTEIVNVVAGLAHQLSGHLADNKNQMFDATADKENLKLRAAEYAIVPIEASYATGSDVGFSGNSGVVVPKGVVLRGLSGNEYVTLGDATLAGDPSIATAAVKALSPGDGGNIAAGAMLTLKESIPGVSQNVTVGLAGISGGADEESIVRLRERLAERKQRPPLGGAAHDYVAWARSAHVDVSKVWVFPHENGLGSVVVRFIAGGLSDPIPSASVVAVVRQYIKTVSPVDKRSLTVESPQPLAVPVSLSLTSPDTESVRAAITAELADFFGRKAGVGETLFLSQISEAISAAEGEINHVLSSPSTNIEPSTSQLPILGVVTFE